MKNAYVVLSHTHVPVTKGEHAGKFQVYETCEFVDAIKNKHTAKSTIIMDVLNKKLIKNRAKDSGAGYEEIEQHIIKGYGDKYKKFLELVGAEIPSELVEAEEETQEDTKDGEQRQTKEASERS